MITTMKRHLAQTLLCTLAIGATCIGTLASAQAGSATSQHAPDVAPTSTAGDDPTILEEIVVTAERRTQNLQRTALAVSALTGDDITKKGIDGIEGLQFTTPSLSITEAGATKNINIRGIGLNSQQAQVTTGVATYFDGLARTNAVGLEDPFYDIADVEVLRGPQGTFVGQNSTGGAVFIRTNDPNFDGVHGDIQAQVGNYDNYRLRGALNVPLSDTFAVRVAGNIEDRGSFYQDFGSSAKPGRLNQRNARLNALWKPDDAFSALLKVEFNQTNTGGLAYKPLPGTAYAPFVPPGDFNISFDRPDTRDDTRDVRTMLRLDYELPSGLKLRSISGAQFFDIDLNLDYDASSRPDIIQNQKVHIWEYSQEINVISPDTGRIKYILGATYDQNSTNVTLLQRHTTPPFSAAAPFDVIVDTKSPVTALGAFGQLTYQLVDSLEVQGGVRYSHERRGAEGTVRLEPFGIVIPNTGLYEVSKTTGKLALNWTVDPNNFLYAFAASGYKAGGLNPGSTFKPETVWDYEAGWKANFLGGHVRTQLGGFYTDYNDFQLTLIDPPTGLIVVRNAAQAKLYGFEAGMQARFGGLGLDGNVAYVHSRVGLFHGVDLRTTPGGAGAASSLGAQCASGQSPPGCFDYVPYTQTLDGRANPYSPNWTINLGAEYRFDLPEGSLTPRVDVGYLSDQWASVFTLPIDRLNARTLVNAQLNYARKDFQITAYGTNLTNLSYVSGTFYEWMYRGAPRQYGVRVSYRF